MLIGSPLAFGEISISDGAGQGHDVGPGEGTGGPISTEHNHRAEVRKPRTLKLSGLPGCHLRTQLTHRRHIVG
jgi:hypothetical protein